MKSNTTLERISPAEIKDEKKPGNWRVGLDGLKLVLLMGLPPLLILLFVNRWSVNVPFWDEWDFATMVAKARTGGLTFQEMWEPHNEHRLIVVRVMVLALAFLGGGWNVVHEQYANVLLAGLFLLVLWRLLVFTTKLSATTMPDKVANSKTPWSIATWLTVAASWLVFSTSQWQNWFWGFQMAWFAEIGLVLATIWLVSRFPGRWLSFSLAVMLSVVATFMLGAGLMVWPSLLLGLMLGQHNGTRAWPLRFSAIWLFAAAGSLALYFYNFPVRPSDEDKLFFLQQPFQYIIYVLAYLGAPIAGWSGPLGSALAGTLLVGMLFYLFKLRNRQLKGEPTTPGSFALAWEQNLPWLQLATFALLNALITATSRLSLGLEYATASRYITISNLAWLGGGVIFIQLWRGRTGKSGHTAELKVALNTKVPRHSFDNGTRARKIAVFTLGVGLAMGCTVGYVQGYHRFEQETRRIREAIPFLYEYERAPDEVLVRLFPGPQYVRTMAWTLEQARAGPFQTSRQEYLRLYEENWRKLLRQGNYQLSSYPPSSMKPDQSTLDAFREQPASTAVSFTHEGKYPSYLWLENSQQHLGAENASLLTSWGQGLTKLWEWQPSGSALEPGGNAPALVLDIQAKEAWYVTLTWEMSQNVRQEQLLWGQTAKSGTSDDPQGWKHFRASVPNGVQRVRVELHYSTGRRVDDSLKVEVWKR